jgi:hypothetical protein
MERIRTISGKLVSGARVALTDQTGETRVARTNPLGYYRFEDVPAGQTYIFGRERETAPLIKTLREKP